MGQHQQDHENDNQREYGKGQGRKLSMDSSCLGGQACGGFGNGFPSMTQQGMLTGNLGCGPGVLLGEYGVTGIQKFLHVVETFIQFLLEAL